MKEVMAILRPSQWGRTKQKLTEAGILAFTQRRVFGRGKQRGLQYWVAKKKTDRSEMGISFIPKRIVILVLPESQVNTAVNALIEANQTGAIGDGKIFVSPVEEVIQVRTGLNENRVKEMGGAPL
ncbi:MAG: P-II family nitrogen regulator [Elusimicrobia bacterium]|nr:P-II family nitrogen regulator [Elusimicrobiota bacterium]MBP9127271.1 P-II family nitrogen regulator [Elusimicrobiota bacterium]MBP9698793.1 P-II family nitrogen regulator [Elusimicrobiota bacterium]